MNIALALFAGVLGSLLTLLVTSNVTIPFVSESSPPATLAQAETSTDLSAKDAFFEQPQNDAMRYADLDAELRDALNEATEERAQLASTLVQLTRQIEVLESDAINRESRDALQSGVTDDTGDVTQEALSGAGNEGGAERSRAQRRIDSLVAAGIDVQGAQAIQARQDQYQLARLELIDQAERENWAETDEFTERMSLLDEQRPDLRSELGDEGYDRYLYESGRNNRVMVSEIIPGSVAESAGLQPGDMLVSYANERIFSTRELQSATREGLRGESVPVTIQRVGQTLFLDVPRGPLGVNLSAEQQNPS